MSSKYSKSPKPSLRRFGLPDRDWIDGTAERKKEVLFHFRDAQCSYQCASSTSPRSYDIDEGSMNWDQLLSAERVRELLIGKKTDRKSDEIRTEVQRDYGRAIFSTPVRRLQDKAQVFPMEPIDAVRTRLTHSLEVSSVARDMAIEVADKLV